jgi:hypothetical protein
MCEPLPNSMESLRNCRSDSHELLGGYVKSPVVSKPHNSEQCDMRVDINSRFVTFGFPVESTQVSQKLNRRATRYLLRFCVVNECLPHVNLDEDA